MPKLSLSLLAALAIIAFDASAASASAWEAVSTTDAITDKVERKACSTQDEFRLCLAFEGDGVWVTVRSLGSDLFDSQLFPALRIDANKAFESVTPGVLSLERTLGSKMFPRSWQPSHVTWRAQVPSSSGQWAATPPKLVNQMASGKSLLMRVYLTGGFQRDVTYSLEGFCDAAAQVYAPGAPPLSCP